MEDYLKKIMEIVTFIFFYDRKNLAFLGAMNAS